MSPFLANQLFTLAIFVAGLGGVVIFVRDLQRKGK